MSADPHPSASESDPKPEPNEKAVQPAGEGGERAVEAPGTPIPASELTPEEQMERFERELKETDWGHQPC